ncbi:MAG TPA: DUF362 domain-containing protein [Candidatus Xenobia bacterium]
MSERPVVWIGRAESYQSAVLAEALSRGFGVVQVPLGRVLAAKCNWVMAHRGVSRHCYTRPEVVRPAIEQILSQVPDAELTFIGNSGAGVPTAVMARRAEGEAPEFRGQGFCALPGMFHGRVRIVPTDEGPLTRYRLSMGPRIPSEERRQAATAWTPQHRYWESILTSRALRDAETLIWFPKLKSNVLSQGLTGACKLGGIGLLLDEDRMDGHNFHNDRRIADMMEIARPDLIVTDAVEVAWGGNQMTEPGKHLGILMMSDNPVAHDVVACHLFGLDVMRVNHVRMCGERGWGPLRLEDVRIVTEVPLDELRRRVAGFGSSGFLPVDQFGAYFKDQTGYDLPLEIVSGPPYEHAGSHGVLLDWLYMSYDFAERRAGMARWPAASLLVGEFEGSWQHSKVYCIGRRASERFTSAVQVVQEYRVPGWISRLLRGPSHVQRYRTAEGKVGWAVHMSGDPPTHRDFILGFFLGSLGAMVPALFRADLIFDSYVLMLGTKVRRLLNNPGPPPEVDAESIARMKKFRPTSQPV